MLSAVRAHQSTEETHHTRVVLLKRYWMVKRYNIYWNATHGRMRFFPSINYNNNRIVDMHTHTRTRTHMHKPWCCGTCVRLLFVPVSIGQYIIMIFNNTVRTRLQEKIPIRFSVILLLRITMACYRIVILWTETRAALVVLLHNITICGVAGTGFESPPQSRRPSSFTSTSSPYCLGYYILTSPIIFPYNCPDGLKAVENQ